MAEPFIGEIRMFGFSFPPSGWALCDGALLAINQNQSLYSLLGTTYGGDGRTSFALPGLRGRIPLNQGHGANLTNRPIGQKSGVETVTLNKNETPSHTHTLHGEDDVGSTADPNDGIPGELPQGLLGYSSNTNKTMSPNAIASVGGQSHENMMPFLVISFCIALTGTYPPRN